VKKMNNGKILSERFEYIVGRQLADKRPWWLKIMEEIAFIPGVGLLLGLSYWLY